MYDRCVRLAQNAINFIQLMKEDYEKGDICLDEYLFWRNMYMAKIDAFYNTAQAIKRMEIAVDTEAQLQVQDHAQAVKEFRAYKRHLGTPNQMYRSNLGFCTIPEVD